MRSHKPLSLSTHLNRPRGQGFRAFVLPTLTGLAFAAGCGTSGGGDGTGAGGTTTSPTGSGGATTPVPGAGGGISAGGSGVGGSTATGAGGDSATSGGTTGAGGSLELHPVSNHCLYGYDPLPSDDTMAAGPAVFNPASGGEPDTTVQPEVLQWMADNKWTGAHVVWHAVRGCVDGSATGLLAPLGYPDICQDYTFLIPTDQNCKTAGDGYQFLLFHRHMKQALQQLWPKHAEDFEGFSQFPTTKEELPNIWNEADPTWGADTLEAADIADHIEDHLDLFPDEGTLGFWLQCPTGSNLAGAVNMPYVGLHFDLHNEWSRGSASEHGLNNGQVNITNYMFWKLHGWIDNVWEKYRVAKGLTTPDSPEMKKYTQDLAQSCNEMDIEIEILKSPPTDPPVFDCPPDVDETGDFHTKVRPIFETETNHCASCHGPKSTSPYAGLTLGGQVSSQCIIDGLKRASNDGGQYKLVEPGNPEASWLYLKASGTAADVTCTPVDANKPCNSASMPPGGGTTMTADQLQALYDWIAAGANYP